MHEPDDIPSMDALLSERHVRDELAVNELCEALGVTVNEYGGMCPFQMTGTVDDYRFYFRCRWGSCTLDVTTDPDDPEPFMATGLQIADVREEDVFGDDTLYGAGTALTYVVRTIRSHS